MVHPVGTSIYFLIFHEIKFSEREHGFKSRDGYLENTISWHGKLWSHIIFML